MVKTMAFIYAVVMLCLVYHTIAKSKKHSYAKKSKCCKKKETEYEKESKEAIKVYTYPAFFPVPYYAYPFHSFPIHLLG